MGRLLRKKSTADKRKKKNEQSSEIASSSTIGAVPVSSDDTANKAVLPQKKSSSQLSKPAPQASPPGERRFFEKAFMFLREVKAELKKVVWPSRKQTIGSTLVVIILVMFFGVFLGTVDIALSSIVRLVLH